MVTGSKPVTLSDSVEPGVAGTMECGKTVAELQVLFVISAVEYLILYEMTDPEPASEPLSAGAVQVRSIELFVGLMAWRSVICPGRLKSGNSSVLFCTIFESGEKFGRSSRERMPI